MTYSFVKCYLFAKATVIFVNNNVNIVNVNNVIFVNKLDKV